MTTGRGKNRFTVNKIEHEIITKYVKRGGLSIVMTIIVD